MKVLDLPSGVVTITCALFPLTLEGTKKLICWSLTKMSGADAPFTLTLTPANSVGRGVELARRGVAPAARETPNSVARLPGLIPPAKLAALVAARRSGRRSGSAVTVISVRSRSPSIKTLAEFVAAAPTVQRKVASPAAFVMANAGLAEPPVVGSKRTGTPWYGKPRASITRTSMGVRASEFGSACTREEEVSCNIRLSGVATAIAPSAGR